MVAKARLSTSRPVPAQLLGAGEGTWTLPEQCWVVRFRFTFRNVSQFRQVNALCSLSCNLSQVTGGFLLCGPRTTAEGP